MSKCILVVEDQEDNRPRVAGEGAGIFGVT
jgi:hypothetical protein